MILILIIVVPQCSNVSITVEHPLEEENVAINCSLQFGSLCKDWTLMWTTEDKNRVTLPTSGYHNRTDLAFQLVINNVTIDYEDARFHCQANCLSSSEDSQHTV